MKVELELEVASVPELAPELVPELVPVSVPASVSQSVSQSALASVSQSVPELVSELVSELALALVPESEPVLDLGPALELVQGQVLECWLQRKTSLTGFCLVLTRRL